MLDTESHYQKELITQRDSDRYIFRIVPLVLSSSNTQVPALQYNIPPSK